MKKVRHSESSKNESNCEERCNFDNSRLNFKYTDLLKRSSYDKVGHALTDLDCIEFN